MPFGRKTATVATMALTLLAFGAPAHAAGRHWTTIEKFDGAKHQACKVSAKGSSWRVYTRVDARHAQKGTYTVQIIATKNNSDTTKRAVSTAKQGKVSKAHSVKFSKTGYTLEMGIGGANAGNGGPIKIRKIGHC